MGKFDDKRLWAVVTAGNTRYLGVLSEQVGVEAKEGIIRNLDRGHSFGLKDGCELPLPAQLGPQGFARIPLAVSIDLTVDPVTIYLSRVSSIYFVDDLSKEDRDNLEKVYGVLLDNIKRQKAERLNLILAR